MVVLDFGLVVDLDAEGDAQSMQVAGTPAYMSPEQAGPAALSPASDWYSVGVILYEALTGRLPLRGQYCEVLLKKRRPSRPPRELVAGDAAKTSTPLCGTCCAATREPAYRGASAQRLGVDRGTTRRMRAAAGAAREDRRRPPAPAAALEEASRPRGRGAPRHLYSRPVRHRQERLVRRFLDERRRRERRHRLGAATSASRSHTRRSTASIDSLTRHLRALPRPRPALMPRDVLALARVFPVLAQASTPSPPRRTAARRPRPARAPPPRFRGALRVADPARRPPPLASGSTTCSGATPTARAARDCCGPPDAPPLLLLASFRPEEVEAKPFLAGLLARADDGRRAARAGRRAASRLTRRASSPPRSSPPGQMPAAAPFIGDDRPRGPGEPVLPRAARALRRRGARAGPRDRRRPHRHARRRASPRLPEGARAFLETLAVAGRPVAFDVAHVAAGLGGEAQSLITALRIAHLVRPSGTTDHVELSHDRIREALAGRLRSSRIQWVHLRLTANALTETSREASTTPRRSSSTCWAPTTASAPRCRR